eukprot:TRINITY_DN8494_c0_g1_i1.p1 TRINITY_DN8494_c0_g1~~TRINITY_DN8494_c0_g1_i1.p1  ORF type:complete len:118 (+),score=15.95 TRINITY_DN8494_c0_g1_i1:54-356(+)
MTDAVNAHIKREFQGSQIYLAASLWFENKHLPNIAKYLRRQSADEGTWIESHELRDETRCRTKGSKFGISKCVARASMNCSDSGYAYYLKVCQNGRNTAK